MKFQNTFLKQSAFILQMIFECLLIDWSDHFNTNSNSIFEMIVHQFYIANFMNSQNTFVKHSLNILQMIAELLLRDWSDHWTDIQKTLLKWTFIAPKCLKL